MILCLGTTPTVQRTMIFPGITLNEVNRAQSVIQSASGKSVNVARVLHTLGEPVMASGFIGGETGEFIRDDLDAQSISHHFIAVEPRTRTCTTLICKSTNTATELVEEHAAVTTANAEELFGHFTTLLHDAELVVLSGSLAPGISRSFYSESCRAAAAAAVPVIVDARDEALRLCLVHRPLVVKPNQSELATTLGVPIETDDDLRRAIGQLISEGAQWAAVTLGREGAIIACKDHFWRIRIPQIPVINPIGSGDAFCAGLAAGIRRGEPMPQAGALAAACGCANALTLTSGVVELADVRRLLGQVRVERW